MKSPGTTERTTTRVGLLLIIQVNLGHGSSICIDITLQFSTRTLLKGFPHIYPVTKPSDRGRLVVDHEYSPQPRAEITHSLNLY